MNTDQGQGMEEGKSGQDGTTTNSSPNLSKGASATGAGIIQLLFYFFDQPPNKLLKLFVSFFFFYTDLVVAVVSLTH